MRIHYRLIQGGLVVTTLSLICVLYSVFVIQRKPDARFLVGDEARQFQRVAVHPSVPQLAPTSLSSPMPINQLSAFRWDEPFPLNLDSLYSDQLTVVTAYFNIGEFQKGGGGGMFTPVLYRHWMKVFRHITNPTIFYFDREDDAAYMRVLRRDLPENLTRIIVVDRAVMWSFKRIEPRIARIFSRPGYPYHPPNTVISTYSAAMHAKYELMQRTIRDNPFSTRYICWLDVGLFRNYVLTAAVDPDFRPFRLWLPPGLDVGQVAYTEVYPSFSDKWHPASAKSLVIGNYVWVCGCFFVGRVDVMWKWTLEYMDGVERMLDEGWMSTDQQVIQWLINGAGHNPKYVTTQLQTYRSDGRYNEWFHLGFISKDAGEQQALKNNINVDDESKHVHDAVTTNKQPKESVNERSVLLKGINYVLSEQPVSYATGRQQLVVQDHFEVPQQVVNDITKQLNEKVKEQSLP